MTILITGGNGFIGSAVARLLLQQGEQQIVTFQRSAATSRLADIAERVEWLRGDVGEFGHVLNAVEQARPDTIYHMGAMLSIPSEADPAASIRANAMGTYHVLEAARLFKVRQVIFASSIGTYGYDMQGESIDDYTLQRPALIYGATKVFGEHLGMFYKRKYDLDYRGLRYQAIIGSGVQTPGAIQFIPWAIEASIHNKPYTIPVKPETSVAMMYVKDAALATVQLANAPLESIKMVNYLIDGVTPTPTLEQLVAAVRDRVPTTAIDFQPDAQRQAILDQVLRPIDGRVAAEEWGWRSSYDLNAMIDDFIAEIEQHPERYA